MSGRAPYRPGRLVALAWRRGRAAVVVAILCTGFAAPGGAQVAGPPRRPPPPERLLLIALDAVPLAVVAEATDPARGDQALFAGFSGPAAMVSSFPSTTNVAMVGLLAPFGATPSPGYEPRFYDRAANRLRGGGAFSYHRLVFPWRQAFDWQDSGLVSGMVGKLMPLRSSDDEIAAGLRAFARSDAPVYLIYVANTDGLGHLKGPAAERDVLAALDRDLRELHASGVRFHTVLFSDHGMAGGPEPLVNVRKGVRRSLRAAGFTVRTRLRDPGDAVIASLGMVSNFEIYTQPGYEDRAAAALAAVPGVELCAFRNGAGDGDSWEVVGGAAAFGGGGRAWFGRRQGPEGDLWAYRTRSGDPLGYAPVAASLAADRGGAAEAPAAATGTAASAAASASSGVAAGSSSAEAAQASTAATGTGAPAAASPSSGAAGDWFPAGAWFAATVDHRFPDALHRIASSFELVANPASVTCSAAPGYLYGARRTAIAARLSIGRLRWTHGALDRAPSLGFLMSDLPGWRAPKAVPFDEALAPFARAGQAIAAGAGAAVPSPPPNRGQRQR